jgi:hypothetical protein
VMEKEDVFLYHQTSHLRFHLLKQMYVQWAKNQMEKEAASHWQ